jgi:hypothetical protein
MWRTQSNLDLLYDATQHWVQPFNLNINTLPLLLKQMSTALYQLNNDIVYSGGG